MAFDEQLAERVRQALGDIDGLVEKKMFGGVGYMLHGNMACGVLNDRLIVRVGKVRYPDAIREPHTRPFDVTGRTMTGWVMVVPEGHAAAADLDDWVQQGVQFALTLPPK